ncbi:MAG: aspartate kinase, partial [Clostridiales bacterium]|nr:aspartate kinase [Clostridiales bacterium]
MALIVQKFGGTSVGGPERVRHVVQIITDTYRQGNDVVVVLSAQGKTTDQLLALAKEYNPKASKRELDQLLSTGEQQSVALAAMCIQGMGFPVVSLNAWQVGFKTNTTYGDARISKIETERIRMELDQHKIVIFTGFQGINRRDDITTLGRGGSDTSAVALAAARRGGRWPMCTPLGGGYTPAPHKVGGAGQGGAVTVAG